MTDDLSENPVWDVAAWIGQYPFRRLRESSLDDWIARADRVGIDRAIISGYDQLFAQNGLEYWHEWVNRIAAHPRACDRLVCWPVVNPAMPGELRRLEAGLRDTPTPGIRLLPNYHGYRVWDACVDDLMTMAREHNLIVQVFVRICDERWQWMLQTPAVDVGQDIAYLASMYPANRLIVSGASAPELTSLADRMSTHACLFADLSRVRSPAFPLDNIERSLPMDRLLLGTLWPLQLMEANVWEITMSRLTTAQQQNILRNNIQSLLDVPAATSPAMAEISG